MAVVLSAKSTGLGSITVHTDHIEIRPGGLRDQNAFANIGLDQIVSVDMSEPSWRGPGKFSVIVRGQSGPVDNQTVHYTKNDASQFRAVRDLILRGAQPQTPPPVPPVPPPPPPPPDPLAVELERINEMERNGKITSVDAADLRDAARKRYP